MSAVYIFTYKLLPGISLSFESNYTTLARPIGIRFISSYTAVYKTLQYFIKENTKIKTLCTRKINIFRVLSRYVTLPGTVGWSRRLSIQIGSVVSFNFLIFHLY